MLGIPKLGSSSDDVKITCNDAVDEPTGKKHDYR